MHYGLIRPLAGMRGDGHGRGPRGTGPMNVSVLVSSASLDQVGDERPVVGRICGDVGEPQGSETVGYDLAIRDRFCRTLFRIIRFSPS